MTKKDPKKGTGKKPKGTGRRLYTDENPKDTVRIKFATPADARATVRKVKKIKKISVPLLVMHGKLDRIVPFVMGKKIYELANEPKFFYFQEYGDHMLDYDEKLLSAIKEFIQRLN